MALIMVVDDDEPLRDMLKDMLEIYHHEVVAFGDGGQATAYLQDPAQRLPDLIISDLMMPDLDGRELDAALKRNERTKHVPLVVISARSQLGRFVEQNKVGTAFLEKPIQLLQLKELIDQTLAGRPR